MGYSALKRVQANSTISSFVPGSWAPNWLHGNAKISKPASPQKQVWATSLQGNPTIQSFYENSHGMKYKQAKGKQTLSFVLLIQLSQLCVVWISQATASK